MTLAASQNPHLSRHLTITSNPLPNEGPEPSTTEKFKPFPIYPRNHISNKLPTKIAVLQTMISSSPWKMFNLAITIFSKEAEREWMGDDPYTSDGLSDAKGKAKKTVRVTKKQVIRKEERDRRKSVRHIRVTLRFDGVDGKRRVRSGEISEDQGVDPLTANDGASFTLTKLLFRNLKKQSTFGLARSSHLCR